MHKDQKRLQEAFFPTLMDRIMEETPEAERDCTVLNRLFIQGPDPLFLMETSPSVFASICELLLLPEEDGRAAIEAAHWQGPAVLMEQNEDASWGLQPSQEHELDIVDLSESERKEALWLLLASCSDCTEEGYTKAVTILDRVRRAVKALSEMSDISEDVFGTLWADIFHQMREFERTTQFTTDPLFGVPMSDHDGAFYVGYKQGHQVVAVNTGEVIFYGTVPTTSLAEQGIKVSKQISPQFGLVHHTTPQSSDI